MTNFLETKIRKRSCDHSIESYRLSLGFLGSMSVFFKTYLLTYLGGRFCLRRLVIHVQTLVLNSVIGAQRSNCVVSVSVSFAWGEQGFASCHVVACTERNSQFFKSDLATPFHFQIQFSSIFRALQPILDHQRDRKGQH